MFNGKSVIVTGASSGIGRQIAYDFAKEGAAVVAVARRKERLEELAESTKGFSGKIIVCPGDMTKKEDIDAMIELAVKENGKLDILVNNAGMMDEFVPIGDMTEELWTRVMNINLNSPAYAMTNAVKQMLTQKNGGSIVNMASICGVRGCRSGAAYTTSKHALVGLTKNTAYMYAGKIRCNVVCPGSIKTEVMDSQANINRFGMDRVMSGMGTSVPRGTVENVSSAVLYLSSDEASFITGAEIVIDGGVICN